MHISIAMCTYNGARYLPQQLESFTRQTQLPMELVVCDDGSTDETWSILSRFRDTAPFRVRLFRNQKNLGSTKNFEKALTLCEGELIALSDQDDVWRSDKLGTFDRFFTACRDVRVAFSDAEVVNENGEAAGAHLWRRVHFAVSRSSPHLAPNILNTLLQLNSVATGATMVLRSELRDVVLPIPETWVHDAWIIWIAALAGGVGVVPQTMIRYRIHPDQQLGLDATSLRQRLRHAREVAVKDYAEWIGRLSDIQRRLSSDVNASRSSTQQLIRAKMQLLQDRMSLSPSFPLRLLWVLSAWSRYRRFARGEISMLKDLFFPSERIPT